MSFSYDPVQVITKEQGSYFNWAGTPAPIVQDFWPTLSAGTFTGQSQAAWSITGNGQYASFGGEFPRVNAVAQQGLVRFGVPGVAPKKIGPLWSQALKPVVTPTQAGSVRVQWTGTYDQDETDLTYLLLRNDDKANPVYRVKVPSHSWDLPSLGFTDSGLTPGGTYKYRVHVVDSDGNLAPGYSTTLTLPLDGEPSQSPYMSGVLADGATNLWRMGEASGAVLADSAGGSGLTLGSGVSVGSDGAIAGEVKLSSAFDGSSNAIGSTQISKEAPRAFSVEAWVKTTSRAGGRIVGFSAAPTGVSPTGTTIGSCMWGLMGRRVSGRIRRLGVRR